MRNARDSFSTAVSKVYLGLAWRHIKRENARTSENSQRSTGGAGALPRTSYAHQRYGQKTLAVHVTYVTITEVPFEVSVTINSTSPPRSSTDRRTSFALSVSKIMSTAGPAPLKATPKTNGAPIRGKSAGSSGHACRPVRLMQPVQHRSSQQISPSLRKCSNQQSRMLHICHGIRPAVALRQQCPCLFWSPARSEAVPPSIPTLSPA